MEKKKNDTKQDRPVMDIREENAQVHPVNPFEKKEKQPGKNRAGNKLTDQDQQAADLEQQRKEGLTERD